MINFGLELWLNIVISIAIWILAFYIFLIVLSGIFFSFFKTSLKKCSKTMNIYLNSKFDSVKKLFLIIEKMGIVVDEKTKELLDEINVKDFEEADGISCKISRDKITYLRDEIMHLARQDKRLEKNQEFKMIKDHILEMDGVYRNTVAAYNADVLGYNYWMNFLPSRWLYKILKVKPKKLI